MGSSSYNHQSRATRTVMYASMQQDQIFEQNTKKQVHKDMLPFGVTLREARDSEVHPHSVPIIFALDVTGSMGHIPEDLIKDGLPKLISYLTEAGVEDPAIMFLAIGDHISDNGPLQISQFESGDEELDMWLSRVWIEGQGGGNRGESYPLAHFFAANYTVTDNWEKRNQKGFLFTIGDERFHEVYPTSAIRALMGGEASGFTAAEVLAKAQEKWHVFHIHPGMEKDGSREQWKEALVENALWVDSYKDIPKRVAQTIIPLATGVHSAPETPHYSNPDPSEEPGTSNVML